MSVTWLLVLAVIVVLAFLLYLGMTAGRLDRLHQRVDTSLLTLDGHLLRRSAAAQELATSGFLDPASSMLIVEAAHLARTVSQAEDDDRALAESNLTAALMAALGDEEVREAESEDAGAILDELSAACQRVGLARRFHNDAVRACRQVRNRRLVRIFRLAGHTPWPMTWEMDDSVPEALGRR